MKITVIFNPIVDIRDDDGKGVIDNGQCVYVDHFLNNKGCNYEIDDADDFMISMKSKSDNVKINFFADCSIFFKKIMRSTHDPLYVDDVVDIIKRAYIISKNLCPHVEYEDRITLKLENEIGNDYISLLNVNDFSSDFIHNIVYSIYSNSEINKQIIEDKITVRFNPKRVLQLDL